MHSPDLHEIENKADVRSESFASGVLVIISGLAALAVIILSFGCSTVPVPHDGARVQTPTGMATYCATHPTREECRQ